MFVMITQILPRKQSIALGAITLNFMMYVYIHMRNTMENITLVGKNRREYSS